ncbi:MAG: hypothetical protein PHT84_02200 [Candidatus Pacebacteria bacterium]|nr:hypothetical protein [Candidatus Paceibacterota bacterium]
MHFVTAATPNPGHPWNEIGDGVFSVTFNQTAPRTYTFPDANATVLTTNDTVTVTQGGTGLSSIASGSVLVANSANNLSVLTSTTGTKILTNTGGIITWGTAPSSMVYPSTGIAVFTGSAWGASITDNSSDWNTAYTYRLLSASGTAPLTLNLSSNALTGSITQATTSTDGYLTSTDWNTFNNKQAALVSGTNIKTINSTSLLGSGDIAIAPMVYPGAGIPNSTGSAWGTSYTTSGSGTTLALTTTPTFTTNITTPLVLGGTSTTQDLTFKTTSGIGTTGADMHFLVGNNGATEAITILNSGNVGIGTVTPEAKLDIESTINQLRLSYDSTNYTDLLTRSSGNLNI